MYFDFLLKSCLIFFFEDMYVFNQPYYPFVFCIYISLVISPSSQLFYN